MKELNKFRKFLTRGIITVVITIFGVLGFTTCNSPIEVKEVIEIYPTENRTTLTISNDSSLDSILTYLTIGADTNFVTNVKGVFGITDSGLQGSFWMHKDSIYTYNFESKGLSGNICFDTVPLNCFVGTFAHGTNLFEFTINDKWTIVTKAQETIDISNVDGCNALIEVSMSGGGKWICGGDSITKFNNSSLYSNFGENGVYPFKCTNCTELGAFQPCLDTIAAADLQPRHICNVSRAGNQAGGSINISYLGNTK